GRNRGRAFADRDDVGIAVAIDIGDEDAPRRIVARQPVARVGEVSLAVAEEDVHAVEVDAKGEIHLAVFIKVSGDNASVVQSVRPLDALPEFPVSLAVAEEDRGTV